MATTTPYSPYVNWDIGELNSLNSSIFEARYDERQSAFSTIAEIFREKYSYDVHQGTGPYLAVVLKVLSGPEANNQASTGGNLTKTMTMLFPTAAQLEKQNSGKTSIRVVARIPEFDVDIPWPSGEEDPVRLALHGEYHGRVEDKDFKSITPGSLIWVTYSKERCEQAASGLPSGEVIGLHQPSTFQKVKTKLSPTSAHTPACQAVRNQDVQSSLYVGKTIDFLNAGVPLRKLKGRIKTGIYGNGSDQTKSFFNNSLASSVISAKHKIPGAAPGKNNAFIWVGHLKNNGYLDLLDRPLSPGRETIIYAPKMLDTSSPIEIKYYFHDDSGFGHAWIAGPNTTPEQSIGGAMISSDFKDKIAPGIKDMIRDGRNFILVIPEMAYSRGFGTAPMDAPRVELMASGKKVVPGLLTGRTARSNPDPKIRPALKKYLQSLPISQQENLLQVTHLRERQFATFDGSYSGGNFKLFHNEVLDVVDQHLGVRYDNIQFVSILGDGLGAINFCSMVQNRPNSKMHSSAESALKTLKINRIDFVDTGLDKDTYYTFPSVPSVTLYEDYLLPKSELIVDYLEFNYITQFKQNNSTSKFFTHLGLGEKYQKEYKPSGALGKRKFSIKTGNAEATNSSISMHIAGDRPVGYAFSMVNDFLLDAPSTSLKKKDSNQDGQPPSSAVPDHAGSVASKPPPAAERSNITEQEKLKKRIEEFENTLQVLSQGQKGMSAICEVVKEENGNEIKKYGHFCKNGVLYTAKDGQFFSAYKSYLNDKKEYMKITEYMQNYNKILGLRTHDFKKELKQRQEELKLAKEAWTSQTPSWEFQWNLFNKSFQLSFFDSAAAFSGPNANVSPGNPGKGNIALIASQLAKIEALTKFIELLKQKIKKQGPEPCKKPKGCVDPPKKLGTRKKKIPVPQVKAKVVAVACEDVPGGVKVPGTYAELTKMIPFYPRKKDFDFKGKRTSYSKTGLSDVKNFKIKKFNYLARGPNGTIRSLKSKNIWSCLADIVENAWKSACEESKYYPFQVTSGIRGYKGASGTSAYSAGLSTHALGLSFDLDAQINGYSRNGEPIYGVYTGAWSWNIGGDLKKAKRLHELGVFKEDPAVYVKTAWENPDSQMAVLRQIDSWEKAPLAYKGGSMGLKRNVMKAAKGGPIVPKGANPTLWLLRFCEATDMYWGNAYFLKRRWKGGKTWNENEKEEIAKIYGIERIVERIQAISWNSNTIEDHMHFQFWKGGSVIRWSEINKVKSPDEGK
tara:strand:- start:6051 stop:9779 length:3729 start_codon:yes stop_codon:yes gene_type:complete